MQLHHELLHDALQEEEFRAVVIEKEPEASEEEEEGYAAGYKDDYEQGDTKGNQEEEPRRETQSLTSSEDGTPSLCRHRVTLEVDGELMMVYTLFEWV
jgi:hypothetical protein